MRNLLTKGRMPLDFSNVDAFSEDEEEITGGLNNPTLIPGTDESSLIRDLSGPQESTCVQRHWRRQLAARVCSMLCCVIVLSCIAVLVSLLYMILKGRNSFLHTCDFN